MQHKLLGVFVAICVAAIGRTAISQTDTAPDTAIEPASQMRLPRPYSLLAAVPGVFVHGSGHFVLGRDRAALSLLGVELAGIALTAAGGIPLSETNASGRVVTPCSMLLVSGLGLIASSLVMEAVGNIGDDPGPDPPLRPASLVDAEFGGRYVYHPGFEHHAFVVESIELQFGRLRVAPNAWLAVDSDTLRGQFLTSYRAIGARAGQDLGDGSHLDISASATRYLLKESDFNSWSLEAGLDGRLDFRRLSRDLSFGFTELQLHYLQTRVDYALSSVVAPTDVQHQLVAKTGMGFYFGSRTGVIGESKFYYNHRHDDLVGGIKLNDTGGEGVLGYLGSETRVHLDQNWGLVGRIEFGSSLHTGLSMSYRK